MHPFVKLFFSASVILAASGSAFGQTVINGALAIDSPTFNRPVSFDTGSNCSLSNIGTAVRYAAHPVYHQGGPLTIQLNSSEYDAHLGLYSGSFDAINPCENAITFDDDGGGNFNSLINIDRPVGTYTILSTTFDNGELGAYTITTNAILEQPLPPVAATPVPVAGLPALAFTSLGLLGAAGFVSRRRKAKAEKV